MEKRTMSSYGWITIIIVVLCLLVSMATPFGNYVKDSALKATETFVNLAYNFLGIDKKLQDGSDYFYVDDIGILYLKPLYANANFSAINSLLYETNNFSKRDAREFLAYCVFNDEFVSGDTWKQQGVSTAKLENMARNAVLENHPLGPNVLYEYASNPNCGNLRQAIVNVYYDKTVSFLGIGAPRATQTNVTENELNVVWRTWAGYAREDVVQQLSNIHTNREAALNKLILTRFVSDSNIQWPETIKITKKFVYEEAERFLVPKTYIDAAYTVYNNILSRPDSLKYEDMMAFINPLLALFTVDELVSLEPENSRADINKAIALFVNGFTLDEFIKFATDNPRIPSSFEIPREINNRRVIAITSESGLKGNTNIREIRLPDSLYLITAYAFDEDSHLQKINLEHIRIIDNAAFRGTGLEKIELAGNVGLSPTAFNYCSNLKEVKFNKGSTSFPVNLFALCTSLEKVYIPPTMTSIDEKSFSYASSKLTIYGESGSYAETYAKENNYAFVEYKF